MPYVLKTKTLKIHKTCTPTHTGEPGVPMHSVYGGDDFCTVSFLGIKNSRCKKNSFGPRIFLALAMGYQHGIERMNGGYKPWAQGISNE